MANVQLEQSSANLSADANSAQTPSFVPSSSGRRYGPCGYDPEYKI